MKLKLGIILLIISLSFTVSQKSLSVFDMIDETQGNIIIIKKLVETKLNKQQHNSHQ
jgi:hypothetical protein